MIEKLLGEKKISSAIFLDVKQEFDKVCHCGLEYKLHRDLLEEFYLILHSYTADWYFHVKWEHHKSVCWDPSCISCIWEICLVAGKQPWQHLLMILWSNNRDKVEAAANKLQSFITQVCSWIKWWRIKLNETKSVYTNFTNRIADPVRVSINGLEVPYANIAKYLDMIQSLYDKTM